MKNIFVKSMLVATFLFLSIQCVCATTIEVEALTPFSSQNPSKNMEILVKEKAEFDNGIIWEEGTVVEGQILDVKQPKRAKRDASFKFFPLRYTYDGKTNTNYQDTFIGKYSENKELDKKKMAASAATTAGGMVLQIPFFSQGVSMVKGMVKNPENNRLKSGVVQVYKDSPVSYIEHGKDIILNKGDIFYLKFKNDDIEDYPNKSHMLEIDSDMPVNSKNSETSNSENSLTIYTEDPEDVLREVEEQLR